MGDRYWTQIERMIQQRQDEERRREADRLAQEARRAAEIAERRNEQQRQEEERKKERSETINRAISRVIQVFDDVKANYDEIRRYPFSEVGVLYEGGDSGIVWLEWGDKLRLAPEEEEIIRRYTQPRGCIGQLLGGWGLPDEIVRQDFYRILAHVSIEAIRIQDGTHYGGVLAASLEDFVEDPNVILPYVAEALLNPERFHWVLRKKYQYQSDTSVSTATPSESGGWSP